MLRLRAVVRRTSRDVPNRRPADPTLGRIRGCDGEHRGTLDIKKRGLLPIVDLARSAALAAGVSAASTAARLDAAEAAETIPRSDVTVLRDAFELITELRMQHQVQQLRHGQPPDNHMDPATLTPLVRTYLREAFRAITRVQRGIKNSMTFGSAHAHI
jgi:CBS domain-containing protein